MDLELIVARRFEEAHGIVALELTAADGGALPPFEPGAHIDVEATAGVTRQYSLCSDPADRRAYRLAVLREPASRGGSAAIHDQFNVGRKVKVSKPRNHFALSPHTERSILVAGGIGVTPLLSMAYALHAQGRAFELHYTTRSREKAAFVEELQHAAFSDRLRLYHDDGVNGQRFDAAVALPPPSPGAHLYICGPGGFMDVVVATAHTAGWSADHIHLERFTAEVSTEGDAFTVVAARSGLTIRVAADQTIGEALAAAGIDLPMSCEQGVCGTCLTDVVDGIPDHRDQYLTDDEKATNKQMTPCCSRSRSPVLTLAL
jgi:vanillate O-demethylase ferredoxin subunit